LRFASHASAVAFAEAGIGISRNGADQHLQSAAVVHSHSLSASPAGLPAFSVKEAETSIGDSACADCGDSARVTRMKVFYDLGVLVEDCWRKQNYSESLFPDIASQALEEANLGQAVHVWDIARWVFSEPQLPKQQDVEARFGNPPITLYSGPRFHIDIYFWIDGTTDIHQHSFAGAFQVLLGSSIHSRFGFEERHAINTHFMLGDVVFKSAEVLNEGAIRKIFPGKEYIHSLFHLDRPSATITIRTYDVPTAYPQYSYRRPYLAVNSFFREVNAIKKLQTVELLLQMQHPDADQMIGELITLADFQTTFLILETVFRILSFNQLQRFLQLSIARDRFDVLLEKARVRHGELVDFILPVFEEDQRLADIVNRRRLITRGEHRFFLALLLNIPSRAMIFELVQRQFPENDPIETVLDWVMDLSTTRVWGSTEQNVLGINDFDDHYLFVLEGLLRDQSLDQIQTSRARDCPADQTAKLRSETEAIVDILRNSILFKAALAA
jgi:hypothetical protein